MTARLLNVGLVGCGMMGRVHALNLSRRMPAARLVAVADADADARQACARECGVEAAYADHVSLLDHPGLEAVVVCTPRGTHRAIIEDAAAARKHIFCEKPLEEELAAADRALAAVARAGVKLQIGFNRRFDPSFRRAFEMATSGTIGRLLTLHITSRDPLRPEAGFPKTAEDLFLETTVHDLDSARRFMGEVRTVFAAGSGRAAQTEREPEAVITVLEFVGGGVGTIDNSRVSVFGYDQRLELYGSAGGVVVENQPQDHVITLAEQGATTSPPQTFFLGRYRDSYLLEMEAFVDCVLNDREPPVSGEEGKAALLLALAALRSYREGRPLEVAELTES